MEAADWAILVRGSSARLPCSSGNRGPEMAFGDTEERLSQFGDKWQILALGGEHALAVLATGVESGARNSRLMDARLDHGSGGQ